MDSLFNAEIAEIQNRLLMHWIVAALRGEELVMPNWEHLQL